MCESRCGSPECECHGLDDAQVRPHPTPCPASVRLPVVRLYAPPPPGPQMPGPGEGLPSSRVHLLAIPSPVPRRVLERLPFQVFGAVRGLRRDLSGSAPSCPLRVGLPRLQGSLHAAGWPVAPPRGFRHCASTPSVSTRRRQSATGLPGDYPDRTCTGWRTRACVWATSEHHLLPSYPGAHVAGHDKW
jgi:hypothetical protein